MVGKMKTLRSTVTVIFALMFDTLFLIVLILQILKGGLGYFVIFGIALIGVIFSILAFANRVECNEEEGYFVICTWRTKVKIDFKAVTLITTNTYFAAKFGGYGIKTYGNREFVVAMPLEYRKMRKFFEMIEKVNSGVDFDVWWYKKPRFEVVKTVGRWVLLILLLLAVSFWAESMGVYIPFFTRK